MTTTKKDRNNRRQQIMETLARMLEENPGGRITTAKLAAEVGVTEAALYRHFPSKGKMFEGLIEFIEETLFSRIHRITRSLPSASVQLEKMMLLVLLFAEKNPGMCRLLMGDALAGEQERLRKRVGQIHERLEMEIRQVLKKAEIEESSRLGGVSAVSVANLLVAVIEGRIHQYVRSDFKIMPTAHWPAQWSFLAKGLKDSP